MRHESTDVLVIGGGATGTGILRDLAMRGFKCLLVERRDLAYGTTGRYHGLLHSGGRYVVKDPQAARECIEENRILRHIMPQCIEDTGGFFVLTPHDDPAYVTQFLAGCRKAGIPVEIVETRQMLKEEPLLDPKITQCFRLPDASADSFLAADLNAESARQHGGRSYPYFEVTSLITTASPTSKANTVVTGVICHDLVKDEDVQIDASIVVNASGAWAGKIAGMAGIHIDMLPGKGTMVALNRRIVNTVINRCKLPSDGDILVPSHTVAVIGTTDIRVADPDQYSIEPWEIRLMLEEGEKIIPGFKQFRLLRAWAGVRPLIKEGETDSNRSISRAFVVIDHAERDSVEGIITITSGKWTTYRKMAEATVDKVCAKLSVIRGCQTHLEVLPSPHETQRSHHHLGARLHEVETEVKYGKLVCECELATREAVEQAIINTDALSIDDIRRDVRLGMGPCQGAFCSYRAAGLLHDIRHPPVTATNVSLRDFLQERWKGNLPILWGQQLRQERLNELIYIDVLNAPSLPGDAGSKLSTQGYSRPAEEPALLPTTYVQGRKTAPVSITHRSDVLVIGAGLAGMIAGWRTSFAGLTTHIIAKGWGTLHWGSGCIDICGYQAPGFTQRIDSPGEYLHQLIQSQTNHPYSLVGLNTIEAALRAFIQLCEESGNPYFGSLESNYLLPTALGTIRPTCLVPGSMVAGDVRQASPMVIAGFSQYLDFYSSLVVDNLEAQGILASAVTLDLEKLSQQKFITGMVLARLFDEPAFCQDVIAALKPIMGRASRVGFPAVLGLHHHADAVKQLETGLGVKVFEIPGLPPSIPGVRLHNMLVAAVEEKKGSIYNGMQVSGADCDRGSITSVWSDAAARRVMHQAKSYVLATGGILGGGTITGENGFASDTVFNLRINAPGERHGWFNGSFFSSKSHPIHTTGLKVDDHFQPIDDLSKVVYSSLYAAGGILGDCDPIRERSLEGVALATGYHVGELLASQGH